MDKNQLKRLAGLPVVTERQTFAKLKVKTPPQGLFMEASKADVCTWLKENHSDYASAVATLNKQITAAGRTLDVARRAMLEACKDELRKAYGVKEALEPFDMQLLRKMAGLAPAAEPVVEKEEEDDPTASAEGDDPAEEVEDEMPAIIAKIAAKVEGKTGDELIELIQKVYDAGFKDGEEAHEAEAPEGKEEVKEATDSKGKEIKAARKPKAAQPTPTGNLTAFIGVDKEDDAGWLAVELAKAGLTVDMEEAMGVFYFNFKNKADEAKATKIAAKLQIALV